MANSPSARLRQRRRSDPDPELEKLPHHRAGVPVPVEAGDAKNNQRQRAGHRNEFVLGTGPVAHAGPFAEQHHPNHGGELPGAG